MNSLRYRGKRARKSKGFLSDNRVIQVLNRSRHMPALQRASTRTLTSLTCSDSPRPPTLSHSKPATASFALFNSRSVKNKRLLIKDYIIKNDVDIFALTESWPHPDDRGDQVIRDLIPNGYSFHHVPRKLGNGGDMESTRMNRHFAFFEFSDLLITSDFSQDIRVLVVYHPPSSNCPMHLDDFGRFLEQYISDSSFLLVAGDFNYRIDDAGGKASSYFCNLLCTLNL